MGSSRWHGSPIGKKISGREMESDGTLGGGIKSEIYNP